MNLIHIGDKYINLDHVAHARVWDDGSISLTFSDAERLPMKFLGDEAIALRSWLDMAASDVLKLYAAKQQSEVKG